MLGLNAGCTGDPDCAVGDADRNRAGSVGGPDPVAIANSRRSSRSWPSSEMTVSKCSLTVARLTSHGDAIAPGPQLLGTVADSP